MSTRISTEKELEWKNLIEQQRQSGLPIEKWCRQNQVRSSTFYYWKDKFFPKQLQKASFTELKIKRAAPSLSLQAKGLHIRIGGDCDPHLRKQLFALFAGSSC